MSQARFPGPAKASHLKLETAGVVVAAEEASASLFVVGQRTKGVAHAVGAHHLLGQVSGPLQIVGGTRGDLAEHDLLSRAAP